MQPARSSWPTPRGCASRCRATSPRPSISRTAPSCRGRAPSGSAALDVAPDWRFARTAELAAHCRDALAERFELVTKPDQAGLVTFRPDGDAEEIVARLRARSVIVRFIPGRDLIRVSCGYWTSEDDIERLVAGLA
jgi:selenocysteine lyase/cysteine desulfurase